MLNDILWPDHIQWQPPTYQTFYRTRPFTEFWVVSIEHLRRVWHADRGRLLLLTPGPVPLGLAYVLLVENNPFLNLSLFYRTMLFEYPSVLSRIYNKVNVAKHVLSIWCRNCARHILLTMYPRMRGQWRHYNFVCYNSLCPKSPSARGSVACLPVRLLFKSTKHNAFHPV